jgi:hypothetical protein
MSDASDALRWLGSRGVTPLDGTLTIWYDPEEDEEQSDIDMMYTWPSRVLADGELPPAERVRLTFGLFDMLDQSWVLKELKFHLEADSPGPRADPAAAEAFWAGCRARLEAPEEPEKLLYSLWVDWFEKHDVVAEAFAAVLGDDAHRLGDCSDALRLRASRVLPASGPVLWAIKRDTYEKAAAVPGLVEAVYHGLVAGYMDLYGSLVAAEALTLLDRLALPPGTAGLAAFREVLSRGAENHYLHPELWDEVSGGDR